ncbi:MAG: cell wall hydrolase [Ruminococcaceae bacterium]|nr:cell wall hydrolase [Oscillospiraceae bacterium]
MLKKNLFCRRFLAFLLYLSVLFAILFGIAEQTRTKYELDVLNKDASARSKTIILDAGHGGEDGGASSADGLLEKDLNLALALTMRDILVANGINVVLTRETDTLLYDRNVDFQGRKKMLDMAARLKIAQDLPDAVFVSLHMNTYPHPSCQGVQVWYSENNDTSLELAKVIHSTTQELLQPENDRPIKRSGSSIYLLHHLECPAVLVECGFLSSPEEATLLGNESYRQQLALTLCMGILRGIE